MKGEVLETERAIKDIKDFYERSLAEKLNLVRVSAPLFVTVDSGLNDDLNGVERAVAFDVSCGINASIVHSLAKWKRVALARYGVGLGAGLYTDMNAIRRDEALDALHSYYVDQWDWELVIAREERTEATLRGVVNRIYETLKELEAHVHATYAHIPLKLPERITFISSQQLEDAYPAMTPQQREYACAKEHGAVFLSQIGGQLRSGQRHDGRAPDYDDWQLNGDIILYYPVLDVAFEISSMGVRVDEERLRVQLKEVGHEERLTLPFHQGLLQEKYPYTIGGGIGQSRLCMFFLNKRHIGEVQASIWDEKTIKQCEDEGIQLL